MRAFPVRPLAGLCGLAAIAGLAPAAPGLEPGSPEPAAWRRVTYTMPAGASGFTVWMEEAALIAGAGKPRSGTVEVGELTIHHGDTRLAGQAYTVERNVYDCTEGFMVRGPVTVFDAGGTALVTAQPESGEPVPLIPHSIVNEIWQAACRGGTALRDHPSARTIAAAIAHDDPAPFPDIEPAREIETDIDRDGQADIVRIAMRPHSDRHDVEIVFAHTPNREVTIIAAQQPPGASLVERLIRPAAPGQYLYDCLIDAEGGPAEPCVPGVARAGRGGIEVVTPGHPSILIFDPHLGQAPVRLPMAGE